MELILFAVLLVVALALAWLGASTSIPAFILFSFSFIFILGVIMFSGLVDVRSGEVTNYTYAPNTTEPSSAATTYTYTSFADATSHQIGVFLALAAALGFGIYLTHMKGGYGGKE